MRSHALCLDLRVILPFASCLTRQLDPTPPPARCPRPLPPSRSPRCPLPQPPPSLLYLPCSPLALAAEHKHIATAFVSLPHFPSARLVSGNPTLIRYITSIPASSITRIFIPAPFCFQFCFVSVSKQFSHIKSSKVMSPVLRLDLGSVPVGLRVSHT